MSLRGLGSLLNRRFSPRRMLPGAQAQAQAQAATATSSSASGSPARYLRALRDNCALGALAVGGCGLAALAGNYFFEKDEPAREVAGEEARSEVTDRKWDIILDESIRAKFKNKDGTYAWLEYIDYINFRRHHPEVTDPEVLDEMVRRRYTVTDDQEAKKIVEQEDVRVDEAAMKARFEDWMKEHDKTYESEEEKARRYEIFKKKAMRCDKANASSPPHGDRLVLAPNNLGDWTEEELYSTHNHQGDFDWEQYIRRMSKMYAEGRVYGAPGFVDAHREVECTEAVKQCYRELEARKAKQDAAARKAKQAAAADNL